MSEYTKGPLLVKVFPLTIGANHDYHVCTEREECVATCWGQDDVAAANANLFAAAPEILEALKLMVATGAPVGTFGDCAYEKSKAAIAKAEGL